MGNTEEHLIVEVIGVPERGAPGSGPHKREGPAMHGTGGAASAAGCVPPP